MFISRKDYEQDLRNLTQSHQELRGKFYDLQVKHDDLLRYLRIHEVKKPACTTLEAIPPDAPSGHVQNT